MSKKAVLTEYTLSLPKIKKPFDLALVSDLHERRSDDILMLLKKAKPDLIAIAGDTFERVGDGSTDRSGRVKRGSALQFAIKAAAYFNYFMIHTFSKKNLPKTENAYSFLTEAAKLAPVYLSLGNHEYDLEDEDIRTLENNGIVLLDNADCCANVKGDLLRIGGLSSEPDGEWLERFSQSVGFKLLLCHHPEYYDSMVSELDIDLVLAGHNHGGQIRLFGHGVLSSRSGLFPRYDSGVFDDRLVVSAGCSNTVALPRLFNPRELVVIHLNPKEAT